VLVTLDYATTVNPVLSVTWPQNGMQVCGTNFTLRGLVDDPTATVTATITDTNGDINIITGSVERTGVLWAEDLPLNSGTNWITLTVTNAAGLASSTNFSIVQSSMTLALTIINGDLWLPAVDVAGVISDPSYAVSVNGVQGTNNGNGTWNAYNVPISSSGIASFDISANNGSGDPDISTNVYKPAEILIQSAVWNLASLSFMGDEGGWQTNSIAGNYNNQNGGTEEDNLTFENLALVPTGYEDDLEFIGTNQVVYDDYLMTGLGNAWYGEDYPAAINLVEGALHGSSPTGVSRQWSQSSQVCMLLYPGGQGNIQSENLFQLSASATEELAPVPTTLPVAATNITIAGLALGTDGNLNRLYPNGGEPTDVTPNAGVPMASFTDGVLKDRLKIQASGVDLFTDRLYFAPPFCVGQTLTFALGNLPTDGSVTATNFSWTFSGNYVNENVPSTNSDGSSTYIKDRALLQNAIQTNWWVSGGTNPPDVYLANVSCNLLFTNGNPMEPLKKSGFFKMYKPMAKIMATTKSVEVFSYRS